MTTLDIATDNLDAPAARPANPPTAKQVEFARDLYRNVRDLLAELHDLDAESWPAESNATLLDIKGDAGKRAVQDRRAMSAYLDDMVETRKALRDYVRDARRVTGKRAPQPGDDVPAGQYALAAGNGVVKFYEVDKPESGRWAGYTFVSARASDERHPIRDRAKRAEILSRIAEDPAAASRLFGIELGRCGVCGRSLTDETSRAYGIGPVCRERTGW
jgi:hypothetical protein